MDRSRLYPWGVRAVWASLALVAGPALADALAGRSPAVAGTVSAGLWAVWAVVACATLVAHPVSLTALRVAAPGALAASVWAAAAVPSPGAWAVAGVAGATVAVAVAFLPETGALFVNGPAYPGERRYPLRPPGPLLAGPVPLAWLVALGGPVGAALLAASGRIVAGAAVAAAAVPASAVALRALHGLARRWVVFVPAGIVLHDPMTLADPVLLRRQVVTSLAPAPADSRARDLTRHAPGLALQLDLDEDVPLVLIEGARRVGPAVAEHSILFTPTRPGRVLAEARDRRSAGAGPPPQPPAANPAPRTSSPE